MDIFSGKIGSHFRYGLKNIKEKIVEKEGKSQTSNRKQALITFALKGVLDFVILIVSYDCIQIQTSERVTIS